MKQTKHLATVVIFAAAVLAAAPEGFVGGNAMRAPWSAGVEGNDDIWIANFGGRSLALMVRADSSGHSAGTKTGDVSHNFQSGSRTDPLEVAVDPAGNVWINSEQCVQFLFPKKPIRNPIRS